jgi:hypothetical protein
MKGGEIKIKYENGGRRAENEIWDNYRFIFPVRASHFRSMSKTVSVPEDLSYSRQGFVCAITTKPEPLQVEDSKFYG